VIRRKVTPIPMMTMYQLLVRMLMTFLSVRKFGTIAHERPKMPMSTPTMKRLMKESLLILPRKSQGFAVLVSMFIHRP
jgi:hypothetical protein